MRKTKAGDLVFIAMFAAVIAVLSQLVIPFPSGIPLTLQTFIIALTGYCLGSSRGAAAVLVYIAIGAVGIPVFSGFRGGIGALFDITGGFILGFIPLAFMCGIKVKSHIYGILMGFAGLIVCHFAGILWFSLYSADISVAFFSVSLPYLAKDFISVCMARLVSGKISKVMKKLN